MKKASGGGSESMVGACLRGCPDSRGARLGIVGRQNGPSFPEAYASSDCIDAPGFGDPASAEFSHMTTSTSRQQL